MQSETFSFRPNLRLIVLTSWLIVVGSTILFAFTHSWASFTAFPLALVNFWWVWRAGPLKLIIDDAGVTLLHSRRSLRSLPWSGMTGIKYEAASDVLNDLGTLVLENDVGVWCLPLGNRTLGRWSDPRRILELVRAQGYPV